jgi:hypothetical protein
MNFSFKYKHELQSEFFSQLQATLHVVVISYGVGDEVVTEDVFFISADTKHDNYFVIDSIRRLILEEKIRFSDRGGELKNIILWMDGCAGHYKSNPAFRHFTALREELRIQILQNFSQAMHGKGPCDSHGGSLKSMLRRDMVAGGTLFTSIEELCEYCVKHYSEVKQHKRSAKLPVSRRRFVFVPADAVVRPTDETFSTSLNLKGIRKGVFCIGEVGRCDESVPSMARHRYVSCSCDVCTGAGKEGESCPNKKETGPWERFYFGTERPEKHLTPLQLSDKRAREVAKAVKDGSYVVLEAGEGVVDEFLILRAEKGKGADSRPVVFRLVDDHKTDTRLFLKGELVIEGKWLDCENQRDHTYTLGTDDVVGISAVRMIIDPARVDKAGDAFTVTDAEYRRVTQALKAFPNLTGYDYNFFVRTRSRTRPRATSAAGGASSAAPVLSRDERMAKRKRT